MIIHALNNFGAVSLSPRTKNIKDRELTNLANIKPFRGYRYNTDKIGNMSTVITPTKYNMGDEERLSLYERNEYNAVRLFDGMEYENDNEHNNKHTRAADYLETWIANDVLVRDDEETIYLYEETVEIHGTTFQNMTFVALLELEELGEGAIRTCEEIREMSKQDRYDLLSATNADMSMISCLYTERDKHMLHLMTRLSGRKPDMEFDSADAVMHQRLWRVTEPEYINRIVDAFKTLPLYITDGQTRYETCVQYRNDMRKQNPNHTGKEMYNYTMVSLINSNSDGVVLMPEHRKIKLPRGFSEEYFVGAVQDRFKIEKIIVDGRDNAIAPTMKTQIQTKRLETKFGVYSGRNYFYRLTLKDKDYIKKRLLPEMSEAYCGLDTVVLKHLVINDVLGVRDEDYDDLVSTSISSTNCFEAVKDGTADVMIVMNPVKVEQIEKVTAAGEKLPFRTVSIFPKPSVGMVINLKED